MNLQMVDNPDIRTATFIADFNKSNVINNRFVKSFTVSLKTVIQKKYLTCYQPLLKHCQINFQFSDFSNKSQL